MSGPALTIGVDTGTTGCRACAVADASRLVATASVHYEPDRPHPGWAEQDSEVWWEALCRTVQQVTRRADTGRLAAVGLSSQGTAVLPLDERLRPLRSAIIWQDTRSEPQCREVAERCGPEHIRRLTGWPPHTFLLWPRVMWLTQNEPECIEAARWLAQVNGFLAYRLCGRLVLDRANAIGYPMEVRTFQWRRELCEVLRFPVEKVPPIVPSTQVVGEVCREASRATGLPEGLPVVAGGMDTACACFAVGADRPERAFEVSGTSGGIGVISDRPSDNAALGVAPHLFDGLYINHAPMSAAGASLEWCKDELCPAEQREAERRDTSAYDVMEAEVESLGPGPTGLLFLPYMTGERAPVWDPLATGCMLGLTLTTSREQIIKAVMEGVAYALRENTDLAEEEGDLRVRELRSCGGGSRSPTWCQIKADLTGRPLVVYRPERDAAFGAALLAGVGVGVWDRGQVGDELERERPRIYEPRQEVGQSYAPYYRAYRRIYASLQQVIRREGADA